jgi:tetratricopeptide (TPR) repeat protein
MIKDFMIKEGLEGGKKNFETVKGSLDLEAQNIIRSFLETFAGRTKTPEKLTRDQIGTYLKDLFAFYETHFQDSKPYVTILKFWMDVCFETSDWKCVDASAEKLISREDTKKGHEKYALDQIVALDRLNTGDPKEYEKRFISKIEKFIETYPTSQQWVELAKKLGQLYVKNKDSDKAIKLFEKVFLKEQSADSLYRLQWARFEAEKYQEVIDEKRQPKGPTDIRIRDLQRESALKLAIEARKDDNFERYSKVIKYFLSLDPPADKATTARRDYFNYMLEKNHVAALTAELVSLPPQQRFSKSYTDILERTWVKAMRQAKYKEASSVVFSADPQFKVSQANLSRRFLSRVAGGLKPSSD